MLIHPVCSPKYKFVKQRRQPMAEPRTTARAWKNVQKLSRSTANMIHTVNSGLSADTSRISL